MNQEGLRLWYDLCKPCLLPVLTDFLSQAYNLLFCASIAIPIISLISAEPDTILLVGAIAAFFALTVTVVVLFWYPLWVTYLKTEQNHLNGSLHSSTSSPSHNVTVSVHMPRSHGSE